MTTNNFQAYLEALRHPFVKLARLRFLNPDGTTAYVVDNNPLNKRSGAFISDGSIKVNLQNGQRRTANVTLSNVDGQFDYDINHLWFGQEIALDEGLVLPDGSEFYLEQGRFVIGTPTERFFPSEKTITYELIDKWANLDGTLYGNLDGTYEVPVGTNIFTPITSLLSEDRGNGNPVDNVTPIYTNYYDNKTQTLPDGSVVSMLDSPYTLRVDGDNGTLAEVISGLAGMVNAWIGYDRNGALRIDPSQDDIDDFTKPVSWRFQVGDVLFLGASYTIKNTEVYNDYIVVGEMSDYNRQPYGRATNTDPTSTTNVGTIGRKTYRESAQGYATGQQCVDLAVWKLKQSSALRKSVSISCSQVMHINENEIVEITRTDKPNSPVERHLIMGFTRPLSGLGSMTIDAVSVNDVINQYETESSSDEDPDIPEEPEENT